MRLVTVLLPVYNGEKYLAKSLDSVLKQSYSELEILLLNDGSTDGSRAIASSYAARDPRIKIIDFKENAGLIQVLNEGIRVSSGEYLARVDSDDEWIDPNKIKKQVDYLENNPECALTGTNAVVVDTDDDIIGKFEYAESDEDIRKKILIKNQFVHSGVVMRKSAVLQCGAYNSEDKYAEDYGLWLRLGCKYKFTNLPFAGVKYRKNPKGETSRRNRAQVVNSFKLAFRYRNCYSNFFRACVKWKLRYLKTLL
jgi:glycosyltransferase involved in cell wall biosynthesis